MGAALLALNYECNSRVKSKHVLLSSGMAAKRRLHMQIPGVYEKADLLLRLGGIPAISTAMTLDKFFQGT